MIRTVFAVGTWAVALGLTVRAGAAAKDDLQALQGKWRLVELRWAEKESVRLIAVTAGEELTIKGNEMTVTYHVGDGKTKEVKYTIALDAAKNPRVLKMTVAEGKDKGKASSSIYAITAKTFTRCTMRGNLPKDFEIRQGQFVKAKYLYTYERKK